jgi:hypothetical protein
MPKKHDTDEPIALAPRPAEAATTTGEICRMMGVAEGTFAGGKRGAPGWRVAATGKFQRRSGFGG